MFSKRNGHSSLALRLSAWYAASAFLLLLMGTSLLYWELAKSFAVQSDKHLLDRTNFLRELLRQQDLRTIKWEVEGESETQPFVQVLSRVFAGGQILVETAGMPGILPTTVFPAENEVVDRVFGSRQFRVLSKTVPGYHLQVA